MSHTITVRLNKELAEWLEKTAHDTGVSQGRLVREQLEKAKDSVGGRPYMRWAGCVKSGPRGPVHAEGLFHKMKGIADTGFLVAFANRRDAHHDWALRLERQLTGPLLTCEAVLAESAFHLQDSRIVLGFVEDRLVDLTFDSEDHLPHLTALAERYADRNPDFADLCLIRMSELHPDHSIITTDREDFHVYRRNKRESIPLICPPE